MAVLGFLEHIAVLDDQRAHALGGIFKRDEIWGMLVLNFNLSSVVLARRRYAVVLREFLLR